MGTQDHPICGCCLADCPDFPGAFICRRNETALELSSDTEILDQTR